MAKNARILTGLAAAGLVAAGLAGPADAQFYKGKTLTFLIGYSPGSSVDSAARSFAPYFSKYLSGNPTIVVKAQPGGGGVRAQNFTYEKMKPDGMMLYYGPIGIVGRLIGAPGNRAKHEKLTFIGATGRTVVQYLRTASVPGYKEPGDIAKATKPINMACTRATSNFCILHRMSFELMGAPYNVVPGFRGDNKITASMIQGEIDTHGTPAYGYRINADPNLVRRGIAVPLWHYEIPDAEGQLQKNPDLPEIPSFREVYRKAHGGKDPSGPMWESMQWITTFLGKLILGVYGPPGLPKDLTATLRTAFQKVLDDKEFNAQYMKQYRIAYQRATTEDGLKFFKTLETISPDSVALMKRFGARMESKKKK